MRVPLAKAIFKVELVSELLQKFGNKFFTCKNEEIFLTNFKSIADACEVPGELHPCIVKAGTYNPLEMLPTVRRLQQKSTGSQNSSKLNTAKWLAVFNIIYNEFFLNFL
jgi:hypothetical protein